MRVIAGEFRSRVLKTLPGTNVRPTPDRLREALFSILALRLEGAIFLDAYAGTGSVGIEALSRGASRAVFIEQNRTAMLLIRENLRSLGIEARADVAFGKTVQLLGKYPADIVFLDPPYPLEGEYSASLGVLGNGPPGLVIAQHASRFQLAETYGGLARFRVLKQGDNSLSFYRPPEI
jgi:16S rRNA (guanine(966)-N(2))-methyltransferase RsmD